jgi:transglutaminase-like putative cysteine protease
MKRIRITHKTEYHYRTPVTFGTHQALLRPREGHDVHIESSLLKVEPAAEVRWLRDIYGNSIAVITFAEPGRKLSLISEVNVDHYDDNPLDFLIAPSASSYPFQYAPNEQLELIPYRVPSYPYDGPGVQSWLSDLTVQARSPVHSNY